MPTTLTEDSVSCSRPVKCTKCRYTWLCLLLLEFSIIVNKVLILFSISRQYVYVNQLPCSHKYQFARQNSLRVVICWSQQMQAQGSYVICFTELNIKRSTYRATFANLHLQLDYYHHFNTIHMFTVESIHQIKSDRWGIHRKAEKITFWSYHEKKNRQKNTDKFNSIIAMENCRKFRK